MRVMIDARPLLEKKRGGVTHYADNIIRTLLANDRHDYALFCNSYDAQASKYALADLPARDKYDSHLPNRLLNAGFAFAGRPLLENLTGSADLLYLPNLNFVATGMPTVVTVHDLSFLHYPEFFSARQRLWHRFVAPAKLLHSAAGIAAVSEHTKIDLAETLGIDEKKIAVVRPAVRADFAPQTAERAAETRRKYRLPERFFLYLGMIEPRKNLTALIAAFDKLPGDAHLVLAGGNGWLYEGVHQAAERAHNRDRIRFLDYVEDADRPALYAAATVFVYPSFYEGFGMPPLEAMASGTPVIAGRAASLGEVVGSAGILVDPYNVTELADAMAAALADDALRATLRARGLERAKRFTWEESANALENVFKTCI